MNYVKNMKNAKDISLKTAGNSIPVRWELLSEQEKNLLLEAGYEPDEQERLWVWQPDLEKFEIHVCEDDCSYEWEDLNEYMKGLIKESPRYLVYAPAIRWDHTGGSWTVKHPADTLDRCYDCSIYPAAVSKKGKVLVCTEYSHDVPMGSPVTIIALTDKEYERVSSMDARQRQAFVERMEEGVVYA